jgi:hypothetical protein
MTRGILSTPQMLSSSESAKIKAEFSEKVSRPAEFHKWLSENGLKYEPIQAGKA